MPAVRRETPLSLGWCYVSLVTLYPLVKLYSRSGLGDMPSVSVDPSVGSQFACFGNDERSICVLSSRDKAPIGLPFDHKSFTNTEHSRLMPWSQLVSTSSSFLLSPITAYAFFVFSSVSGGVTRIISSSSRASSSSPGASGSTSMATTSI